MKKEINDITFADMITDYLKVAHVYYRPASKNEASERKASSSTSSIYLAKVPMHQCRQQPPLGFQKYQCASAAPLLDFRFYKPFMCLSKNEKEKNYIPFFDRIFFQFL